MKLVCSPDSSKLPELCGSTLPVLLYHRSEATVCASAGAAIVEELYRARLVPNQRAIDFLSLALSIVTADLAIPRAKSPDGWTRQIDLKISVADPDFWNSQIAALQAMLRFLTTDIWNISFLPDGFRLEALKKEVDYPEETSVALLSGGADSLVGVLDLVASNERPFVISQTVHGDGEKQGQFATSIGGGLRHLQLNHNAKFAGDGDRDQRARSMIFLAYGVLAATTTKSYQDGGTIPLYVCENGFISVNAPLTEARVGSLSTRTTHPIYLSRFQQMLNAAGLRVRIINPYQFKTKGEMFAECRNQGDLKRFAHVSTSCSRFRTFGLEHCGRCVPCLIRRAAFHKWGITDETHYKHADLAKVDDDHANYDDVRSAAMAFATVEKEGVDALIGATLSSEFIADSGPLREVVVRGFAELKSLFESLGIR
ncbi:Qat anti-phage system QueC-like protein QatC [Rosistilla oblonga]|uniref:Qat anti-phage system QueC-like protein QatC n=1 Tax=Rosistilla oblonga TaxID=2527990 RepID=UPI003A97AC6D